MVMGVKAGIYPVFSPQYIRAARLYEVFSPVLFVYSNIFAYICTEF